MISYGVYQLFNLIMFFMLIKVLLSWFPNIDWYKEPFNSLKYPVIFACILNVFLVN